MNIFEKLKMIGKGVLEVVEENLDDILKLIGVGTLASIVIKVIKKAISEATENKKELEALLKEIESAKTSDEKDKAIEKAKQCIDKSALLKKMFSDFMEDEMRKISKEATSVAYIWFALNDKYELTKELENAITVLLYGKCKSRDKLKENEHETQLFKLEESEFRGDTITYNAYTKVCDFLTTYSGNANHEGIYFSNGNVVDSDDELYTNNDPLYHLCNNGIYVNCNYDEEITDEDRAYFDTILEAINICLSKDPNKPEKVFTEYFIVPLED